MQQYDRYCKSEKWKEYNIDFTKISLYSRNLRINKKYLDDNMYVRMCTKYTWAAIRIENGTQFPVTLPGISSELSKSFSNSLGAGPYVNCARIIIWVKKV